MFGDGIKYKCRLCWQFIIGVSDHQHQVPGDVMTQETYRVEREGVDKNKKKKSVAFKASSSSKNEGKSKKESSDD